MFLSFYQKVTKTNIRVPKIDTTIIKWPLDNISRTIRQKKKKKKSTSPR